MAGKSRYSLAMLANQYGKNSSGQSRIRPWSGPAGRPLSLNISAGGGAASLGPAFSHCDILGGPELT
jgi:hypothetical protein